MKYMLSIASLLCCSYTQGLFQEYRGVQAYKQGDFAQAQEELQRSLINNPHDAELLYNNGDVAFRLQEYEKAEAYFKKAVATASTKDPVYEKSLYNLGTAYAQQEKLQDALQTFNQLLRHNPAHERALHNKKVVEQLLQKKEQEQQSGSSQSQKEKKKSNKKDGEQSDQQDGSKDEQETEGDQDQQEGEGDDQQGSQQQKSGKDKGHGKQKKQDRTKHDASSQGSDQSEQQEAGADDKGTEKDDTKSKKHEKNREKSGQQEEAESGQQDSSGQADQKSKGQNDQGIDQHGAKNQRGDSGQRGDHKNLSELNNKQKASAGDKKPQQNKEPLYATGTEQQDSEEDKKQPEYKLLKAIDQAEQEVGKDLFKTMMRANMKGHDGQKNW